MVIAVVEGVVRWVAHANATYTKLTPTTAPVQFSVDVRMVVSRSMK